MCTEFNLKIDESTELLDTRTFNNYDTNELLQLSDTIKQSCFEFLFSSHIECCPYCGSIHIVKAGKSSKGRQRYKCNNCKRRFINSTNHLMHWSHLSKEQWETLFYSSLNNDYLSKTAKLVGISIVSAFYNRHKLMYVLNELINKKQLSKKIALDETYLTYQAKGFVNQNRRGISKDKIGIACAIDEDGNYVVHTADRGRPTSSTLIDIFKNTICPGSIVISDSQRSYHQLMDELNIKWVKIPSGEKSKDGYTLEMVNRLHDRIKTFFRGKRNVMTHYLQGYLALFQYSELHTMMIGSKMFQDEFMKINNILSGIRNKDICPEVNLYKTLYEC